jgi:hypothetical protein
MKCEGVLSRKNKHGRLSSLSKPSYSTLKVKITWFVFIDF